MIDVGCGHGIIARNLAPSFKRAVGVDPSKNMVEQAKSSTPKDEYPNVEYHNAPAEDLPFIVPNSVDLYMAGQAAHWFDYPKLFKELNRIMKKGGTMAFFGYKDNVFVDYPNATRLLDHYSYHDDKELMGSYWTQPGRSIVVNKLRAIKPPESEWGDIQRIEYEPGTSGRHSGEGTMFMSRKLTVGECKEYIRTWSAYHTWKEAHEDMEPTNKGGKGDLIDRMFVEMAETEPELGDENKVIEIEWGSALILARKK